MRSQTSRGRLLPDVRHRLSPSLLAGPLHTPVKASSPGRVSRWHAAPRPHLTLSRTEISATSHCLEIIQNNNPQTLCWVHFKTRPARAAPIFPANFARSGFCPSQPCCSCSRVGGHPAAVSSRWGGTARSLGGGSPEHPGVGQPGPWGMAPWSTLGWDSLVPGGWLPGALRLLHWGSPAQQLHCAGRLVQAGERAPGSLSPCSRGGRGSRQAGMHRRPRCLLTD